MVLNIYIARRRTYYCSSPHDVPHSSRAIYTCVMCLLDVAHCISVQCLLAYISHLHAASWSAQQSQSWQHLDVQWPTANWPSWHRWNQVIKITVCLLRLGGWCVHCRELPASHTSPSTAPLAADVARRSGPSRRRASARSKDAAA